MLLYPHVAGRVLGRADIDKTGINAEHESAFPDRKVLCTGNDVFPLLLTTITFRTNGMTGSFIVRSKAVGGMGERRVGYRAIRLPVFTDVAFSFDNPLFYKCGYCLTHIKLQRMLGLKGRRVCSQPNQQVIYCASKISVWLR